MNNAMRNGQHNQRKAVTTNLPPITGTNFGKVAEEAITSLKKNKHGKFEVTTSQIRVLLSMTNNFYKELLEERDETLNSNLKSMIQYLRMKFAYQAGRDRKVKAFVEKANLMGELENIGESREKAMLFCKYMESLVAYHKYHGGRDR